MATGSCQGIIISIATTAIWPSSQPSAVVIGGKNGAEALFMRIRSFSVIQTVTGKLPTSLQIYQYIKTSFGPFNDHLKRAGF